MTRRALKFGVWGKTLASMRPILWPNMVSKLFRINSGYVSVEAAPWPQISARSFTLETRNVAVGPSGKCDRIRESKESQSIVVILTRFSMLLIEQHEICEVTFFRPFNHIFDQIILSFVILAVGKCWLDLFEKVKYPLKMFVTIFSLTPLGLRFVVIRIFGLVSPLKYAANSSTSYSPTRSSSSAS